MNTPDRWQQYNQAGATQPARPRVSETLKLIEKPGHAMDLGAGGGRDSLELLRQGWSVDAVDNSSTSIELLNTHRATQPKLNVIQSSFETLAVAPSTYDLITGSYALPFCDPEAFEKFWPKLIAALKPGGVISVELFGVNDTWNKPESKMTFHTRAQVENLLQGLKVEVLREEEKDQPDFSGANKHWHIFTVIARKSG